MSYPGQCVLGFCYYFHIYFSCIRPVFVGPVSGLISGTLLYIVKYSPTK